MTWNETGAYERLASSPDNRWLGNDAPSGLRFSEEPYDSQWGGERLRLAWVEWNASQDGHQANVMLWTGGRIHARIEPAMQDELLRATFGSFASNVTSGNSTQIDSWYDVFATRRPAQTFDGVRVDMTPIHQVDVGDNDSVGALFQRLSSEDDPAVDSLMGFRTIRFRSYSFHFQISVAELINPIDQWGQLSMDPQIAHYSYGRSWGDRVDEDEVRRGLRDVFNAFDLGELDLTDEPIALSGSCVKAWR